MTEVPENAPKQDLEELASVQITPKGRVITLNKPCFAVSILRKINEKGWEILSSNAPIPYLDSDKIAGTAEIEYKLEIQSPEKETLLLKVSIQ